MTAVNIEQDLNGPPLRGLLDPEQLVDLGAHLGPEGEGAGEGASAQLSQPLLFADGTVAVEEAAELDLDFRLGGGAVGNLTHHGTRGVQHPNLTQFSRGSGFLSRNVQSGWHRQSVATTRNRHIQKEDGDSLRNQIPISDRLVVGGPAI